MLIFDYYCCCYIYSLKYVDCSRQNSVRWQLAVWEFAYQNKHAHTLQNVWEINKAVVILYCVPTWLWALQLATEGDQHNGDDSLLQLQWKLTKQLLVRPLIQTATIISITSMKTIFQHN